MKALAAGRCTARWIYRDVAGATRFRCSLPADHEGDHQYWRGSWPIAGVGASGDSDRGATIELTERERGVLRLVAAGRGEREIAHELGLGVRTVRRAWSDALRKCRAESTRQAAAERMLAHLGHLQTSEQAVSISEDASR